MPVPPTPVTENNEQIQSIDPTQNPTTFGRRTLLRGVGLLAADTLLRKVVPTPTSLAQAPIHSINPLLQSEIDRYSEGYFTATDQTSMVIGTIDDEETFKPISLVGASGAGSIEGTKFKFEEFMSETDTEGNLILYGIPSNAEIAGLESTNKKTQMRVTLAMITRENGNILPQMEKQPNDYYGGFMRVLYSKGDRGAINEIIALKLLRNQNIAEPNNAKRTAWSANEALWLTETGIYNADYVGAGSMVSQGENNEPIIVDGIVAGDLCDIAKTMVATAISTDGKVRITKRYQHGSQHPNPLNEKLANSKIHGEFGPYEAAVAIGGKDLELETALPEAYVIPTLKVFDRGPKSGAGADDPLIPTLLSQHRTLQIIELSMQSSPMTEEEIAQQDEQIDMLLKPKPPEELSELWEALNPNIDPFDTDRYKQWQEEGWAAAELLFEDHMLERLTAEIPEEEKQKLLAFWNPLKELMQSENANYIKDFFSSYYMNLTRPPDGFQSEKRFKASFSTSALFHDTFGQALRLAKELLTRTSPKDFKSFSKIKSDDELPLISPSQEITRSYIYNNKLEKFNNAINTITNIRQIIDELNKTVPLKIDDDNLAQVTTKTPNEFHESPERTDNTTSAHTILYSKDMDGNLNTTTIQNIYDKATDKWIVQINGKPTDITGPLELIVNQTSTLKISPMISEQSPDIIGLCLDHHNVETTNGGTPEYLPTAFMGIVTTKELEAEKAALETGGFFIASIDHDIVSDIRRGNTGDSNTSREEGITRSSIPLELF